MKRFCRLVLLFSIPIFIGILVIHLYVDFTPAMFRNKARFIQKNKDEIEVLFLGSSHTQEAINPLLMQNKCANLAYNAQDIVANCALFNRYVEELPELKIVFFEFDYFTLEQPLGQYAGSRPLYRKFHNLPDTCLYGQISSVFADISFFRNYIYECWKYMRGNYSVNDAGYVSQSDHNPFGDLDYDSIQVNETARIRLKTRHKKRFIEEIPLNSALIDSLIVKAKSKNIQVVFLALPKYQTYIEREIPDMLNRRNMYLNQKLRNKDVLFFDYEKDPRFKDTYSYLDDNHLGHNAAIRFTAIIDSLITTIK